MKKTIFILGAAMVTAAALALGADLVFPGHVAAQPGAPPAGGVSQETTAPQASRERDAYFKALDGLNDEQAAMVPVVLAAVGEIACDGLQVDREKAAGFIAAHASDDSEQAREDAANVAKSTTDVLLGPWLAYVHQDSGAFCEHAYALQQSGQDLWKH